MISLARRIQLFHGRKFLVDPACAQPLDEMGINAATDCLDYTRGELISDSSTTRCCRITAKDGTAYYFKRYYCSTKNSLLFWMRPGKAAVEVWAYRQLAELGISTLDVVAFGEQRVLGVLKSSFLITRAVPDSHDLNCFALSNWYQMPEPTRRQIYQDISNCLLEQMRVAHKGSFFHHDLKWRNILIHKKDGHYSTIWIDAPRASTMPLRNRRGVVVDFSGLARIAISLLSVYDRMRFIYRYLGSERRPGDATRLYREVAANLGRRPPNPIVLPTYK